MKHQDPLQKIKNDLAIKYGCSYLDIDKCIKDFFMTIRYVMGQGNFDSIKLPGYGTWWVQRKRVEYLNKVAAMSPELKKDKYARLTKEKHDRLLSQTK